MQGRVEIVFFVLVVAMLVGLFFFTVGQVLFYAVVNLQPLFRFVVVILHGGDFCVVCVEALLPQDHPGEAFVRYGVAQARDVGAVVVAALGACGCFAGPSARGLDAAPHDRGPFEVLR